MLPRLEVTQEIMKILFLSATEYAVEHFVGPYIAALHNQGHDLHVLTGGEIGDYRGLPGIQQQTISLSRRPSPAGDFRQLLFLTRHMRKHRFDVVYSISPKGGLIAQIAAKLAGIKQRVHFVTGQTWKTRRGLSRLMLKKFDTLICKLVTKAYVDSRSQAEFLIKQRVLNRSKAVILGSGSVSGVVIDQFLFSQEKREKVRKQFGIQDSQILVFFLGRISSVKGVGDLVDAFKIAFQQNENLRLLIIGPDDGDRAAVVKKIESSGLRDFVRTQWSSTPRPAEQYSAAEIFCVPSYMEGFGNVVLESACAKVPAIGSNIYGLQDAIVDNQTGVLFEVGNTQELASQIVRLANDESLRKKLGNNAYQRVRNEFSQAHLVEAFMRAHHQLTDDN